MDRWMMVMKHATDYHVMVMKKEFLFNYLKGSIIVTLGVTDDEFSKYSVSI